MTFTAAESWLHRMHPLVKLGWLLWATVAVFAFASPLLPVVVVLVVALLLCTAGVAPWRMRAMPVWGFFGVTIFAAQVVLVREGPRVFGEPAMSWPVLGAVTTGGIAAGVRALGRLLAVVLGSALFVRTTEPVTLTCALMRAGLPARWGFALVTALRLAPVFRVEAHHAYRAQLARGVAYDAHGPRRWWLLARHLSLPLVVSALRTAHQLSLSMEGRGFGRYPTRTQSREVPFRWSDALGLLALVASFALAVAVLVRGGG